MTDSHPHDIQSTIPKDIYCPRCSYNLFGTVGDRCPECGYSLSYLTSETSSIPWDNRRDIGRFRAYWKTVWCMFFRRERFAEQYALNVNYSDARLFQWVTILHVIVPVIIATILAYQTIIMEIQQASIANAAANPFFSLNSKISILELVLEEVWPVVILFGCFLIFLVAVTGVASYFFHPKEISIRQQNNAIALSYYTCAPLSACVPLSIILIQLLIFAKLLWHPIELYWQSTEITEIAVITTVLFSLMIFIWWSCINQLQQMIIPHLNSRRIITSILIPILWLFLGGLILVVLPVLIVYILVIFTSLA